MDVLRWDDRVYGPSAIEDPEILAIVGCPTFRRLNGIRQAGPSALAYAFKTVTRHEHSLGVYLLLRRLGADPREQVAGLLHDVSHTAFSHAVDFVFASEEQDHHEQLKPEFLERPDLKRAVEAAGFSTRDFYDDSVYPLLERPLPWLCADRLDYFFRDSLACGVSTPEWTRRALGAVVVVDRTIAIADEAIAREIVEKFATMNRDWWASPVESYIYNEFADALREGFRLGVLDRRGLLGDDAEVLDRLRSAGSPLIDEKLRHIAELDHDRVVGYVERVAPKNRWLDPPVASDDGGGVASCRRLSELSPSGA